jgi:two-component system, NtrC family, response regulator
MKCASSKVSLFLILIFLFNFSVAEAKSDSCRMLAKMTGDLEQQGFVVSSPEIQQALLKVARYAEADLTVLITGETGTGKEMVANLLHQYNSRRRLKPFVVVDLTRMKGDTSESRLFGHEMGSFTGAVRKTNGALVKANGGTIFLDEVEEMSLDTQAMFLRFLDTPASDRTVESIGADKAVTANTRIVAATNVDLAKLVVEGKFRADLFYRLNVGRIDLKPLRERREEIVPLANQFLRKYSALYHLDFEGLTDSAKNYLNAYAWPGNIRQLENSIHRSVLDAQGEGKWLDKKDIQIVQEVKATGSTQSVLDAVDRTDVDNLLERIEALAIRDAYVRSNKVQKDAGDILGISPRVFNYKWKTIRPKFPDLFPVHEFGPMPTDDVLDESVEFLKKAG